MQPRLAKKIVQRVRAGDVQHTSYRQDQVKAAFKVMGVALTEDLLKPWLEKVAQEDPALLAIRVAANQQRRAEVLKRVEEVRRARQELITKATDFRLAFQKASEEHQDDPGTALDVATVSAVLETEAEMAAEVETGAALHEMTVPELRALAKIRGLKGYSSMPKPDLITLLTPT